MQGTGQHHVHIGFVVDSKSYTGNPEEKVTGARTRLAGSKPVAIVLFTQAIVNENVKPGGAGARPWSAVFLAALLLGMPAAVRAQAPQAVRLTLRDAVQLALQQNPQVQIANLNLAQRGEDRKISRSGLLPQVSLGAYEQVRRVNIQAQIGIPFPGFP